jgi:uncharacterized protein YdaU (DUF1376 family)
VNYYEHHLGDYAKDAGHLSLLEDGAYRRLLDVYYGRERALPLNIRECCKLARAVTKAECEAVTYVLEEFFEPHEDGRHQKRADKEIARFLDKQAKARRSAHTRWNPGESHSEVDTDVMPTHCESSAHQAPGTKHQTPDIEQEPHTFARQTPVDEISPDKLAAELTRAGIRITSQDPRLIAAAHAGITSVEIIEQRNVYPDKPAAYLVKAASSQRAEAKGATYATRQSSRRPSAVDRVHANIDRARRNRGELTSNEADGNALDGTAVRITN